MKLRCTSIEAIIGILIEEHKRRYDNWTGKGGGYEHLTLAAH